MTELLWLSLNLAGHMIYAFERPLSSPCPTRVGLTAVKHLSYFVCSLLFVMLLNLTAQLRRFLLFLE